MSDFTQQVTTRATDDGYVMVIVHRDYGPGSTYHSEVAFAAADVAKVAAAAAAVAAGEGSRDVELVDGTVQVFTAGMDWDPELALLLRRAPDVPYGGVDSVDVKLGDAAQLVDALTAAAST